jgi:hypothetical protein
MALLKDTITLTALAIALAGCATALKDVPITSVSPLQYANFDCDQLGAESARLTTRIQELGGRLDQAAKNDQAIAGVGALARFVYVGRDESTRG